MFLEFCCGSREKFLLESAESACEQGPFRAIKRADMMALRAFLYQNPEQDLLDRLFKYALEEGSLSAAELLLEQGAGVDSESLWLAISANDTYLVSALLEKGLSAHDSPGYESLLTHAVREASLEVVKSLVKAQAKVTFVDIHYAVKRKDESLLAVLFSASSFSKEDYLDKLLAGGQLGYLSYFLENGLPVDSLIESETLLHRAVRHFRADAVDFLLKKKASVDAKNFEKQTPLHSLAYLSFAEFAPYLDEESRQHIVLIAKLLHLYGADKEARNSQGQNLKDFSLSLLESNAKNLRRMKKNSQSYRFYEKRLRELEAFRALL